MSKNIFFTSDQHIGHRNVIKYCNRPFAPQHEFESGEISFESVNRMNEALVDNFNKTVGPNDITYHLGDFSMSAEAVSKYLPRLNGEHHLIAGNHDQVHPLHYRKRLERATNMRKLYYDAGFKTIQLDMLLTIDNQKLLLHHMPYLNLGAEAYDVRFKDWRPVRQPYFWLLHGHTHCHQDKRLDAINRMYNVGVDAHDFKPVHADDIIRIICQEK